MINNIINLYWPPYRDPTDKYTLPALGRKLTTDGDDIKREGRASNGELRRDIIAGKHTIRLEYSNIDDATLEAFEFLRVMRRNVVLLLQVHHNDMGFSYRVLLNNYRRTRDSLLNGGSWSGVTLEFVEV